VHGREEPDPGARPDAAVAACEERPAGTIDRQVPKGLHIHMILGNYGTHTHDNVAAWLDKHPRFHLPFVWTAT
jgi:hypothetical protein